MNSGLREILEKGSRMRFRAQIMGIALNKNVGWWIWGRDNIFSQGECTESG